LLKIKPINGKYLCHFMLVDLAAIRYFIILGVFIYSSQELDSLTESQRNDVWKHIVKKSGEARVSASNGAKWMGRAGRGLFVLIITIAIYHIAVAEDKVKAAVNEGVAGGMAGAASLGAAGLLCGPAAIACVPLGVFVGGVLGAVGADWAFDKIWD
jgi:hypothetical protein